MDLSGFLIFCGVYAMATFSPGPAVAAIVARTLAVGLRRTAPFILGIVAGDLVWFALVALGLAALAQNFQPVFLAIKYAGVAYLLYLAGSCGRRRPRRPRRRRRRAARAGSSSSAASPSPWATPR